MKKFLPYILLLLLPSFGMSQSHRFTHYSEKNGLKNRFVYSIDQDKNGYLMIGTGEGLYQYDGFTFKEYSTENGLVSNFITCSVSDKQGNLWYGHDNGSVSKYQNGKLESINLSKYTNSRINQILSLENEIWVLTQNDGILKKDSTNQWTQFKTGIEDYTLYSIFIDRFKRIWLGTDIGLLLATLNGATVEYEFIDEIIESKVSCILNNDDQLFIGTEDIGIFKISLSQEQYEIVPLNFGEIDFTTFNINALYCSPIQDLWICTNNKGLIQLSGYAAGEFRRLKEYSTAEGFDSQSTKTCTADREGNIWIGTIGNGLTKIEDSFLNLFPVFPDQNHNVYSVFESADTLWSGGWGVIKINHTTLEQSFGYIGKEHGLPNDEVTNLSKDEHGTLWIGTGSSGLFKLLSGSKGVSQITLPDKSSILRINKILSQNNIVYVATNYGVYQFVNDKLLAHITIQSGLSINSVKSLFADRKGRIWFGTSLGQITYIENGELKNLSTGFNDIQTQIRCITEDNKGDIWIGTDGMGVIKITGDTNIVINKTNGIYSDYCYSIICDQRNNLWIGHHGALSKINLLDYKIEIFDPNNLLNTDFLDNATHKTMDGSIVYGTSNGILHYNPEFDVKNEVEPVLQFEQISINDKPIVYDGKIKLEYGRYNIKFDFIGVSLKNVAGVKYQFYLEGYDNEWLPLSALSNAVYNKIGPGSYVFHIRCYNSDGFGGNTIISLPIFIDKPFWEKWWFIALCFAVIVLIIRYVIHRRERILIANQKSLQIALDQRTKEVVVQKELLEIKNKDITDSILYAKNIQQAMLPSEEVLKQHFENSFVLFKPRDIVSGDFYWTEKYGDTIVVACADCTGHGVPGAFMSLIGSTLLKDVAGYADVKSSADVLTYLDKELFELLNKQGALSIQDGMDISVMDYNTKTRILRIASANRPVIIYSEGQRLEIKGDRQSIGGSNDFAQKQFNQHEYYIKPGDCIYLFSDGITDQFGGEDGKKLKRSGLIEWLEEVSNMPLAFQHSVINEKLEKWKGSGSQTDDIIMLGIKFD